MTDLKNDTWAKDCLALLGKLPSADIMEVAMTRAVATGYNLNPKGDLEGLLGEVEELKEAILEKDPKRIGSEIGDVIFHLINYCRMYGLSFDKTIDDLALRWLKRKELQECKIHSEGYTWRTCPLEVKLRLWKEAKAELKESEDK